MRQNSSILTCHDAEANLICMNMIKISSKVDEAVWTDLKELAHDSHQQISGLLTEAIAEYLQRKKIRPAVLEHLQASMSENNELGKLLAK